MGCLLAAVVPLTLWAAPSLHGTPRVRVDVHDGGTFIRQHALRRGLGRYGYVRQERFRVWVAATPAMLDDVRRQLSRPAAAVELPTAASDWAQWTSYGNDHVFTPDGVEMIEDGGIHSLPYSLMIVGLVMPAAGWAALRARGTPGRAGG